MKKLRLFQNVSFLGLTRIEAALGCMEGHVATVSVSVKKARALFPSRIVESSIFLHILAPPCLPTATLSGAPVLDIQLRCKYSPSLSPYVFQVSQGIARYPPNSGQSQPERGSHSVLVARQKIPSNPMMSDAWLGHRSTSAHTHTHTHPKNLLGF